MVQYRGTGTKHPYDLNVYRIFDCFAETHSNKLQAINADLWKVILNEDIDKDPQHPLVMLKSQLMFGLPSSRSSYDCTWTMRQLGDFRPCPKLDKTTIAKFYHQLIGNQIK